MARMNTTYANLNEVIFTLALESNNLTDLKDILNRMPPQPDASVQGILQEITYLFHKRDPNAVAGAAPARIDFKSMYEVVDTTNPHSDINEIIANIGYYNEFRTKFEQALLMAEIFKNKLFHQNKTIVKNQNGCPKLGEMIRKDIAKICMVVLLFANKVTFTGL